MIRFRA